MFVSSRQVHDMSVTCSAQRVGVSAEFARAEERETTHVRDVLHAAGEARAEVDEDGARGTCARALELRQLSACVSKRGDDAPIMTLNEGLV